jgi:hypothetical protein
VQCGAGDSCPRHFELAGLEVGNRLRPFAHPLQRRAKPMGQQG